MMVPRSYSFLHQPAPSVSRRPSEKMGARCARTAQPPSNKAHMRLPESNEESVRKPEPQSATPAAPMHSKPVVIPPRTPTRTPTSTQTVRVRGHNGERSSRVPKNHQPDAIPPAVAALLAVTNIPSMPPRRRKRSTMDRRISMDEVIQEWRQDDDDLAASVTGSPLDILLGRVDESDDECGSFRSLEQEKGSLMTARSLSSESLDSTVPPSLDPDVPSYASQWDDPSTPESYTRRPFPERKEKIVQSPPAEDCILDHPLLHFAPDECEELANLDTTDIVTLPPVATDRFRSFRSNLTASFQALKSAAKSFSNFTAPSVPPDDLLTRSLLSPKFTSEMRPKLVQGVPPPALRRYLNPQPTPTSLTELSMQLHDALMLDTDDVKSGPMIQMQTYERRSRSSSRRRRTADPFSEAGRAQSPAPAVRQREPRENSDFLRVIVLEMNMRRVGKLDAKAIGKARIWLPPRKPGSTKAPLIQSGVPERWIGTPADAD
ncbi:hypothetical protein CC78DRAFT_219964 [Lojkania enalia]|uniref:Uncharacterized protein n=1 Tax=Lojkania enalia TaxID=147567 RepID=A0A9P4KES5_9PLEO|nr:hypothetical protein CC78DRAFT_219964 [Didymosphaeria enalia]